MSFDCIDGREQHNYDNPTREGGGRYRCRECGQDITFLMASKTDWDRPIVFCISAMDFDDDIK